MKSKQHAGVGQRGISAVSVCQMALVQCIRNSNAWETGYKLTHQYSVCSLNAAKMRHAGSANSNLVSAYMDPRCLLQDMQACCTHCDKLWGRG